MNIYRCLVNWTKNSLDEEWQEYELPGGVDDKHKHKAVGKAIEEYSLHVGHELPYGCTLWGKES